MSANPQTRDFSLQEAIDIGVRMHKAGQLDQARSVYDQILTQVQHPVAISMRGLIAHQQGDNTLAERLMAQAIAMDANNAVAHCNLGTVLIALERFEEAITHLEAALRINPGLIAAQFNLGNACVTTGRPAEAITHFERTLTLEPGHMGALTNLAAVHNDLGQFSAAVKLLRRITEIDPQHAEGFNNLGAILGRAGAWDEAIRCYQRAIAIRPDYAEALNNLGALYLDMGDKQKAHDCFSRAPAAQPGFHAAASNQLFLMHYEEQWPQEKLLEEAKDWGERYAPASARLPSAKTDKNPERRLRIGYVSADLRAHPVGFFMESILTAHAVSGACDVFCYSDAAAEDDTTRRLRLQHSWRSIHGLKDESVARLIRDDRIDVLIDLAGHTAHNRLTLFGRKSAPVQITYLGYFDTTGLEAMDYILCDAQVLPPQNERWFVEKPLRLPEGYLCYTPPPLELAVAPPPSATSGQVTFGCFNKVNKMSDETFRVWAQILTRMPGAKLYLKNYWLTDETVAGLVRERFAGHGIGAQRLIFESYSPHREYLECYNRVDVALDPLLYSGGTTTAEALWMGTPVITLPAERFVSRLSGSILASAGCTELIAATPEDYVEKACALAQDVARLAEYKASLRGRFVTSPACDARRFVGHLEDAYRQAWKTPR